jgi:transcriptional regulator with XRE-family HTH domain
MTKFKDTNYQDDHLIILTKNGFYSIGNIGMQNMGNQSERIKELRTTLNLSQRQFAKRIFVSQTLVNEIELGKRKINIRILHLISYQFNANLDWLKKGEGEMFFDNPPDIRLENIIDTFNKLDKGLQDYLLLQSKELLKIQKETIDKKTEIN